MDKHKYCEIFLFIIFALGPHIFTLCVQVRGCEHVYVCTRMLLSSKVPQGKRQENERKYAARWKSHESNKTYFQL